MLRNTLTYYSHQRQSLCNHRRWFICFSLYASVCLCVCLSICRSAALRKTYGRIFMTFQDRSVGQHAREQLSNFVVMKMIISIEDIINLILIFFINPHIMCLSKCTEKSVEWFISIFPTLLSRLLYIETVTGCVSILAVLARLFMLIKLGVAGFIALWVLHLTFRLSYKQLHIFIYSSN